MPIETIYAHKAGTSDWLAMVHIDDRSDLYRFHLGSRRFPTAPLAPHGLPRNSAAPFPPSLTTSPGVWSSSTSGAR